MQSIQRGFEIVEVLWRLDGAGPTDVAAATGLHKSTAHVYLRSLEEAGYAVNRGGTYELSYRFLTMGSRLKNRSRVYQAARRELERLARRTGELSTLVVEESHRAVILHQERGTDSLELGTYSGMTTPLHTTASGKALLAHLPQAEVEEVLSSDLDGVTEHTVTDPDVLRERLERIRADGHAVDADQQVVGMGVIAVPVLIDGRPVASLAVASPSGRIRNESYQAELLQYLRESQDRLVITYRYG